MLLLVIPSALWAQSNSFSFQGRLNDGTTPANGSYDLQFRLFSAITGGAQIGTDVSRPNTTLINGVFSVMLDFGATAFNDPNAVFIEIGVKPNGSPNAFTILGPRQQLTVVPFAVRAMNATNADNATNAQNAQNATNATSALTAANASALNGLGSSNFIHNTTTTQPSTNFNISGSGVINGNLNVAGNNTIGGNAAQNRDKSGYVKAMAFIDANSNVVRCYNGITGATTGNCGFTVIQDGFVGRYSIDFGFQVDDRFVAVSPLRAASVNIVASFNIGIGANKVAVFTAITDVTFANSPANNGFMIVIY